MLTNTEKLMTIAIVSLTILITVMASYIFTLEKNIDILYESRDAAFRETTRCSIDLKAYKDRLSDEQINSKILRYEINDLSVAYDAVIEGMEACVQLKSRQYPVGLATIGGDYFWVYTRGRTITQVLETCTHEYAHTNLHMKDGDWKSV